MKNMKNGRKKEGSRGIGRRRRLSELMTLDGRLIEIRGRSRVTVFECRKILSYGTEEIVLCVADGTVAVYGEALLCVSYNAGCVSVEGRIDGVSFRDPKGGGKADADK